MMKNPLNRTFIRFIIVGVSNTLISYVAFLVFYTALPDFYYKGASSQVIAYIAGLFWSYHWNRNWSFQQQGQRPTFLKFIYLQLSLMLISATLINWLLQEIALPAALLWWLIMLPIILINYVIQMKWIFINP